MRKIRSALSYLWALNLANMKFYKPEWKRLLVMSFFMMTQNSLFFVLWYILFGTVKELKGWQLQDVARMYGIISSAVGISLFFFNGARTIAYRLHDGTMDSFLTKPRAALPAILFSASSPASLGDIFYGPLIWIFFGAVSWSQAPLLVFLTFVAASIFTAMTVIIYSTAFWLKGNTRFPEQLFITLIIVSSVVQHGQPFFVQLIMYSVMPAAFIVYLPTQLVQRFDPALFALVLGAAAFYVGLAVLVFNAGVRRFKRAVV